MQRLLVFEPRMLGDAILSLPFLRGAMERYDVFVCCLPKSAPIYRWILPPEKIIEWEVPWDCCKPAAEKWSEAKRVAQRLRALRFDAATCVWPDARAHLWMVWLGIPRRIGFPMNRLNYYGWQRPWRGRQLRIGQVMEKLGSLLFFRPLLTTALSKDDNEQRHWRDWQQIGETLGAPWRDGFPWFPVPPPPEPVRQFVEAERAQGRSIWMVHPGARMGNRRWALERFQEIVDDYFPAHNGSVLALIPPDSPSLSIRREHQMAFSASTLEELAAVVAAGDGLLSNDSMIVHLAAALGKKVVTVFGPGGIGWFSPFHNEEFVAAVNVCPHRPCLDRCLMPSSICLEQLDVTVVTGKLNEALRLPR